jgi:hypothetical protein
MLSFLLLVISFLVVFHFLLYFLLLVISTTSSAWKGKERGRAGAGGRNYPNNVSTCE